MQGGRGFSPLAHRLCGRRMVRLMCTALQVLGMITQLAQDTSGSAHMLSFPIVGSAAQGNFGFCQAEMICRAGFNDRQRLNELRRRTGEG